jgi:hypothetical protein
VPVDARKLKQLVMVEREVHRQRGTHTQHYWVRQEDVRKGDRVVRTDAGGGEEEARFAAGKPRPPGMGEKEWQQELERRRLKNEYVRAWRAKRAAAGKSVGPTAPPPPLPPPVAKPPPGLAKPPGEGEDPEARRKRIKNEYVRAWRARRAALAAGQQPPPAKPAVSVAPPPPPPKPPPPPAPPAPSPEFKPPEPPEPGQLPDFSKKVIGRRSLPGEEQLVFNMNAPLFVNVGYALVEAFKTTPYGVSPRGVSSVGSAYLHGNAGVYHSSTGGIEVMPEWATAIGRAIRTGAADSESSSAFKTLTHEMFHATSHPSYTYEPHSLKRRPHAMMQEATTETLGQMYKATLMRALGVTPYDLHEKPLFEERTRLGALPDVHVTRSTSYATPVQQFARIISVIHGTKDINENVDRWARAIKGTRGGMRYRMLADALLSRYMQPGERNAAWFEHERNKLAEDADNGLPHMLQNSSWTPTDIDKQVERSVARARREIAKQGAGAGYGASA